jgi:hypothetical protein
VIPAITRKILVYLGTISAKFGVSIDENQRTAQAEAQTID